MEKINRRNFLRKGLGGLAFAAIFSAGCEPPPEENPYTDLSNSGRMFRGETADAIVDVDNGRAYDLILRCTNDGDSDRLSIYADDVKIGEYVTRAIRTGGNGWYTSQESPAYRFIATNNKAVIKVHVDSADKWGVWPKMIKVTEAEK